MIVRLREARLLWPAAMTLAGLAALAGLGVWQVERKAWKEGLIARLAARTKAEPVTLAAALEEWSRTGDVEYLRVTARGRFLHDKERFVYAPDPELGPGYHVYTPLEVAPGGAVLLVNRGYVPEAKKDPESRKAGRLAGEVEITGLARRSGSKGFFTPDNDTARNLWFWRDLSGMLASAFGDAGRPHAPFFLEAEAREVPGGWPRGGVTLIDLPNRHLEYAITWFGLAAALLAVFTAYAVSRLRQPKA